ncbi:AAA family ATPase [Secundilactobacillus muriivasis]
MDEQTRLTQTYNYLGTEITRLTTVIQDLEKAAKQTKIDLAHDTRLNLNSYTDTLDTFANIESGNRQIDTLNAKVDIAHSNRDKATLLQPQAYFARVDLAFPDEAPEAFYIGKVGYLDSDGDNLIYDWRTPVADTYYANQQGATSYLAHGREIHVDLSLRRQLVVDHDHLTAYFDNQGALNDPVLLNILAADHAGGLQDITTTIQAEQNDIIRNTTANVLIVDGVAGSGKTSVLLQRIAYLRYIYREQWTAADFLLLTPSPVFAQYIKDVLPALGETNPMATTLDHFLAQLGHYFGLTITSTSQQNHHLTELDHALDQVDFNLSMPGYAQTPTDQSVRQRLRLVWRKLVATDQQPEAFNDWLDWHQIQVELGLAAPLTDYQQLYLLLQITNYHQDAVKALFVDEAQDYTADQLLFIRQLFNHAHITLVGDHNQVLSTTGNDYAQLASFFEAPKRVVTRLRLLTSYRATGAITRYFGQFGQTHNASLIKPVQPDGATPVTLPELSTDALIAQLTSYQAQGGSVAIITPTTAEAQALYDHLTSQNFTDCTLVTDTSRTVTEATVQCLPLKIAKGLEFDHVLLSHFNAPEYQVPIYGDHRRYVAASRATQTLLVVEAQL